MLEKSYKSKRFLCIYSQTLKSQGLKNRLICRCNIEKRAEFRVLDLQQKAADSSDAPDAPDAPDVPDALEMLKVVVGGVGEHNTFCNLVVVFRL